MENQCRRTCPAELRDYGGAPLVVNIDEVSNANQIGAEVHPDVDQFIRIESGCGLALTGCSSANLNRRRKIDCHSAVIIPAGTWHNIVNTGNRPLKLYSVYAPPQHPFGTVHRTKTDAV